MYKTLSAKQSPGFRLKVRNDQTVFTGMILAFLIFLLCGISSCTERVKPEPENKTLFQYEELQFLKVDSDSVKAPEIRAFNEKKIKIVSANNHSSKQLNPLYIPAGKPLEREFNIILFDDSLSPAPIIPKSVPAVGKVHQGIFPEIVPAKDMAQEVQNMLGISYYKNLQGLKSSYVGKIIEDRRGNLWAATRGGGVCRYDGSTFAHFTEKEGLVSRSCQLRWCSQQIVVPRNIMCAISLIVVVSAVVSPSRTVPRPRRDPTWRPCRCPAPTPPERRCHQRTATS